MTSGQVGYEAYKKHIFDTREWILLPWENLVEVEREGWEAAAKAVEGNLTFVPVAENADEERGE